MVVVRPFLAHIPQTGQRAGHKFTANHGDWGTAQEADFDLLLSLEALDTPARLLTLLRPSTSPEVIQPAGGKRQHHQEGEGGAQDIANYGM